MHDSVIYLFRPIIFIFMTQARFPFKRNRLRCVRYVNENRKKRKRLRWQAANHGCHCFDRAFLLAGACVCCVKILRFSFTQRTQRKRLRLNGNRASACCIVTGCYDPCTIEKSKYSVDASMAYWARWPAQPAWLRLCLRRIPLSSLMRTVWDAQSVGLWWRHWCGVS